MLVQDSQAVARAKVDDLMVRSGRLVMWIAQQVAYESMRQLEVAKLTGALPGEVQFDYEIAIKAYLR